MMFLRPRLLFICFFTWPTFTESPPRLVYCPVPWVPAKWVLLPSVGTSGEPGHSVPNGQASHHAQSPIPPGWGVVRCCEAFGGPGSGGRGAARAQGHLTLLPVSPPPPPDDGKLSFEEFQNYFADGVLSPRELRELFSSIDGHPTE